MRHSIVMSADGATRDEAERQALEMVTAEWAGEPHSVHRLGSTRNSDGSWHTTAWSSNQTEETQA